MGARYKIEFGVAGIEKTVAGINRVRSASQARAAAAEAQRRYANLEIEERIAAEKALPVKKQLANLEKERARNKQRLAEAERKLQEREARGLKSPASNHRVQALRLANKEIDRHIAKLKQANNESRKGGFGSSMMGRARGLAASAGAYFGVRAGRQAIADIGELQRQSGTIGVGAEFLQEVQFAGSQNSITGRQTAMGLQRFARRVQEAQAGKGELRGTLDELGLDAVGKSTEQMLNEFADAIARLPEDQRLRHAFKAFDSEGARLVTILANGSAGLKAYAKQAHESGSVIENEVVMRLAVADSKLVTLGRQMKVTFVELIDTILPIFDAMQWVWRFAVDNIMAGGVLLTRFTEEVFAGNLTGALDAARAEMDSFSADRGAMRERQRAADEAFAKAALKGAPLVGEAAPGALAAGPKQSAGFRAPAVDELKRIGGFRGEGSDMVRELRDQRSRQEKMLAELERIRREIADGNRQLKDGLT